MAAGGAGASGRNSGSSPALESTLDRRFQTVSNSMESIQGLSVWCIENKKFHSVIVRYWMKWLRKSDSSHRLNLFYLANDVIQNCKRKNAIVYRSTYAEVLPEAIKLISNMKDCKVTKSVTRILSIWQERNVFSEEFIHQLNSGLLHTEEPTKASVNSKAALKSKIVAEFVPTAFIEHLSKYRKSMDEIELREKQLAAMRVDVCSTQALKKLKDKAGGKRFSKDFEDGSTKLREFVSFLDKEVKKGPSLMEALENADIFYQMQYKEVKVVAKAYETFANRVSHLKRKLDTLKAVIPDPNDSPIPSPVEDAPSPTGSESPFRNLSEISPELDGQEMDEDMIGLADAPSPLSSVGGSPKPSAPVGDKDNRDVEDMELSDVEETETPAIIVEERTVSSVVTKPPSASQNVTETSQANEGPQTKQVTTPKSVPTATQSLPGNLAGIDLGKISSILSSFTNVMKSSAVGVTPVSRSSPSVPSTPTSSLRTPTTPVPPANPLASLLSRVDINPNALLSALSKTQPHGGLQGLSSLLNNPTAKITPTSTSEFDKASLSPPPTAHNHTAPKVTSTPAATPLTRDPAPQTSMAPKSSQSDKVNDKVIPSSSLDSTLDSKIDNFLQGNPGIRGFNLGFPSVLPWPKGAADSPITTAENLVGTPVRDEAGATPTQDEIIEVPKSEPSIYQQSAFTNATSTLSLTSWQEQNAHADPQLQSGAEVPQNIRQTIKDFRNSVPSLAETEVSKASNQQPSGNIAEAMMRPGAIHQAPRQNPLISNMGPNLDHVLANSDSYGAEPYHVKEPRQDLAELNFFTTCLPPIPKLPPPPTDFRPPASSPRVSDAHVPTEEPFSEAEGSGVDDSYIPENSVYSGHFPHEVLNNQQFHSHGDGSSHFVPAAHHVPEVPPNGAMDYNHQRPSRVHLQHPPNMPHHHIRSPTPARGYHEGLSPPQPVSDDPYFDSYYDHPPRSPSPTYDMHHASPHVHEYYPEDIPSHYPERGVPPHLEPRPLPPHHVHSPQPGHYPPPRPLRRPPPGPFNHRPPFPRGKRPGPPFGAPPRVGGPFYPPKRPYLPPRY